MFFLNCPDGFIHRIYGPINNKFQIETTKDVRLALPFNTFMEAEQQALKLGSRIKWFAVLTSKVGETINATGEIKPSI